MQSRIFIDLNQSRIYIYIRQRRCRPCTENRTVVNIITDILKTKGDQKWQHPATNSPRDRFAFFMVLCCILSPSILILMTFSGNRNFVLKNASIWIVLFCFLFFFFLNFCLSLSVSVNFHRIINIGVCQNI